MNFSKSIFLLLLAALFICGTAKNEGTLRATENKDSRVKNSVNSSKASAEVSIGDTRVVRSAKDVTPVNVMIILSRKVESPVTVSYSTNDGTAKAGTDYDATSGSVTFAPGEQMKRISVSIMAKKAGQTKTSKGSGASIFRSSYFPFFQADEDFTITLSSLKGAAQILKSIGIVKIITNFLLNVAGSGTNRLTSHQVEFTVTGFTSLFGTDPNVCGARTNGHVTLSGILTGVETVDPADDVNYRGVLQMDMDIDVCSVMRLSNGEDKECALSVFGYGPIPVELEIREGARGGYIKFDDYQGASLPFISNVSGSCDPEQTDEERPMVPYKTIASVFNGFELPMLTGRTLYPGQWHEGAAGFQIAVNVLW
ncbi:MAG TPA: Calx-beta domain-containing protein [Chitinophagaceae bacterium]|jgi:hypothetical protein|nr:Calx-beta domain-containing protein [Chitinophagaceae bacterium]